MVVVRKSKRVLALLEAHGVRERARQLVGRCDALRVLGLDINTNSTGYSVLDARGE